MKLIENNPFRVLGVKANATPSEMRQQGNLIAQYLKIGQSAKLDFDITPPLSPLVRTKEMIDLQGSRIHSTEDKILHSLFWFIEANAIDKIALKHLTGSKDIDKALSDFGKGCRGFVAGPDSYSAMLNYSTLQIIAFRQHKDLGKLKDAIAHKFSIVSDTQSLGHLKKLVASDGMNTSVQRILELAMPKLKELLKELVPSKNTDKLLLEIFKSNTVIYPGLRNQVIDAMVSRINRLVDNTEAEREKALKGSYAPSMLKDVPALGDLLLDEVKAPLKELEDLLGKSDPAYTDALQKVCQEVNYCSIVPFNKMMSELNGTEGKANEKIRAAADISAIVNLYSRAKEHLVGISIPIKETLLGNLEGISRFHTADNCEFCHSGRPVSWKLKVQMHKMTGYDRYTYFQNGGVKVPACTRCFFMRFPLKLLSIILGIASIPLVIAVIVLKRYFTENDFKWVYKVTYKHIYCLSVKNHPLIKEYLREGYELGMP